MRNPSKCLLTPEREPTIDQRNDTSKVYLCELLCLLGLFTAVWVRGYLQEQKLFKDSCITKVMGDMSLTKHTTAYRQLHMLDSVLSRFLS